MSFHVGKYMNRPVPSQKAVAAVKLVFSCALDLKFATVPV